MYMIMILYEICILCSKYSWENDEVKVEMSSDKNKMKDNYVQDD